MPQVTVPSDLVIRKVPISIGDKLQYLAKEAVDQIAENFNTQGIYPSPQAPTKARSRNRNRFQTSGGGVNSFIWQISNVTNGWDIPAKEASIDFFYNYYLKFAEMGVGKHGNKVTKKKDVKSDQNAHYTRRYMNWDIDHNTTQRPAIMMEFRHVGRRLERYLMNSFGVVAQAHIVNAIETGDFHIEGRAMRHNAVRRIF